MRCLIAIKADEKRFSADSFINPLEMSVRWWRGRMTGTGNCGREDDS